MDKQIVFIPGLFALGMLAGVGMMYFAKDEPVIDSDKSPFSRAVDTADFKQPDADLTDDLARLHVRIDAISDRLAQLESSLDGRFAQQLEDVQHGQEVTSSTVDTPITALTRPLTVQALTQAGLDASMADEIVRRKNQLELDKLELRDEAVRGDYLGAQRYIEELQELLDSDVSLREELGDEMYDRYLFSNGQANRIRVASVMTGSAANESGIVNNDLIVSYDQQRVFEYAELQHATTQGDREEFVSMTVSRDGQDQVLWVPRGPLGIRLTMTRVDPDK